MRQIALSFVAVGLFLASAVRAENPKATIPTGSCQGYADSFAISKEGSYILDNGCEVLGVAIELEITKEGVTFNEASYAWDAPGFQASRMLQNRIYERINIRGKSGLVTVVDLTSEHPKGIQKSLLRMVIAPKPQ